MMKQCIFVMEEYNIVMRKLIILIEQKIAMIVNKMVDYCNWTVYNGDRPVNQCLGTVGYCKQTVGNNDMTESHYKGNVHHGDGD